MDILGARICDTWVRIPGQVVSATPSKTQGPAQKDKLKEHNSLRQGEGCQTLYSRLDAVIATMISQQLRWPPAAGPVQDWDFH